MKQIYYFTLALGILFSTTTFVSCGGDDEKSNPENTTPQKTADRDEMGNIKINAANFPDAAFRNYLYDKYGADGVLTEVEIDNVTKLELEYRGIKTLEGIEFFPLLEVLKCNNNQLTSLDVSGCTALTTLYCQSNQLTSLNVSGCTALTDLECYQNQISGAAMDALVESLPTVNRGEMRIKYFENEQNVMTTTQVAAARAKGWVPYCSANVAGWYEYDGINPAAK